MTALVSPVVSVLVFLSLFYPCILLPLSLCLDLVLVVCLCCVDCLSLCFWSPSLCVVFSLASSQSCLVLFASGLVLPTSVLSDLVVCLIWFLSAASPSCVSISAFSSYLSTLCVHACLCHLSAYTFTPIFLSSSFLPLSLPLCYNISEFLDKHAFREGKDMEGDSGASCQTVEDDASTGPACVLLDPDKARIKADASIIEQSHKVPKSARIFVFFFSLCSLSLSLPLSFSLSRSPPFSLSSLVLLPFPWPTIEGSGLDLMQNNAMVDVVAESQTMEGAGPGTHFTFLPPPSCVCLLFLLALLCCASSSHSRLTPHPKP
jgi:hypothetical protein